MKTFKETLMEVQAPLSQGEKNFVDLHKPVPHQNLVPGVTDQDFLFQGGPRRMDPKTASYEIGKSEDESKSAYDKNLKVKEEVELDEAIKIGSKVRIHSPKHSDIHGKVGTVGEIRPGAHKTASKKYTVDYNYNPETGRSNSVQLDRTEIKLHKEAIEPKKLAWAHNTYSDYVKYQKERDLKVVPKKTWHEIKSSTQTALAKEDVEQVDELSNELVSRALRKARERKETGEEEVGRRDKLIKLAGKKLYGIKEKAISEEDDGWYAHHEMHGDKGISKEDWKKGWRMNSKGQRVQIKKEAVELDTPERHDKIAAHLVDRYGKNVSRKHIDSVAYDLKSDPDKILAAVKKHQASMKESVEQVDEAFAIEPGAKIAYKDKKGNMTYGKVHAKDTVQGQPGVHIKWQDGTEGRFPNHKISSLSMDKQANYVIGEGVDIEEAEQVDEIADTPRGKKRLADYLGSASDARGHRGMSIAKKDKRYAAIAKASKILDRRLRGEEVEQVEEAKATYCGRCGTTHVPPSQGGKCPAVKEEAVIEKTLTPNEKRARERIAKGIAKSNPNMPMSKKMAIATARAKEVAEAAKKLIGRQHEIDANNNGRIDAEDFPLLKAKKKAEDK
jgi:hypothetical protein